MARTEQNIEDREKAGDREIGRIVDPESMGQQTTAEARRQARHGVSRQPNGGTTEVERLVETAFDRLKGATGDLLIDLGNQVGETGGALSEQGNKADSEGNKLSDVQKDAYAAAKQGAVKNMMEDMTDEVSRTQNGLKPKKDNVAKEIADKTKELLAKGEEGGHIVTRMTSKKLQGNAEDLDSLVDNHAMARFGKPVAALSEADRVRVEADAVGDILGDALQHIDMDDAITKVGKRAAIAGYAFAIAEVIKADNKAREAAKQVVSGVAGSVAAGGLLTLGGGLSATGIGLPLGIAIILGGAYLGSTASETVFDWIVPKDVMKDWF